MKVVRNVPTYALWPVREAPVRGRGYVYLWSCGHEDAMPHACSKGPNRGTLFQAPDLRIVRPGWFEAAKRMDRWGLTAETDVFDAMRFARRRVGARRIA